MTVPALDRYDGCEACDYSGYRVAGTRRMRCDCITKRMERMRVYEPLITLARPSLYERMTFEAYLPQNAPQADALKSVRNLMSGFYVFGPFGVGKTHLMAAIVNALRQRHMPAVLFTIKEVIAILGNRTQEGLGLQRLLESVHYLVIDDLNTEYLAPYVKERIYHIINTRYLHAQAGQGHTSLTSQIPFDKLGEHYGGRIEDRILGMTLSMVITGPSMRQRPGTVKHYEGVVNEK